MRNIYYAIISGTFLDDFDEAIRTLKMDTGINEVILLQADAFVLMVEAKLRDPAPHLWDPTASSGCSAPVES